MRKLGPEDQQKADAIGLESRNLGRQAQAETRNKAEADRMRTRANELGLQVRAIQQAHMERTVPLILDKMAMFDLTNLQPGVSERAMRVKRDPSFPDPSSLNRGAGQWPSSRIGLNDKWQSLSPPF